ncbi:MAG: PDZ domain-containing protein, partial [Ruminiclostridium sp.]|nr:PDZ domain-containing protein [Ruminiclostridium sp.]
MKVKPIFVSVSLIAAAILIGNTGGIKAAEYLTTASAQECAVYEERKTLVPCGTPFGIKMLTDGVVVTDFGTVNIGLEYVSPAELAGIRKGDIITAVNDISVCDSASLSEAVQVAGESCTIDLIRNGQLLTVTAKPVISSSDGQYKLGLWTRD